MDIKTWKDLGADERKRLLSRCETDIEAALPLVAPIVEAVRLRGDAALREYSLKLDRADLGDLPLAARQEDFDKAEKDLPAGVKEALAYAVSNTIAFHKHQKPGPMSFGEIRPGLFAGEKPLPLASAGLYVPRGRGSFPSMLYMLAVPALVAGVAEIRVVSPPNPDGSIDAACLHTVRILRESASGFGQAPAIEVFRVGGAQGIAALAYGTQSIRRVVKVVGPGSRYVAAAKRLLAPLVDTGLPAGPSESIVLADGTSDPRLVAMDLLIEAEHGSDSCALLVTPDEKTARAAAEVLPQLIGDLPEPRRSFARDVFANYGGIILAGDMREAADIVNAFSPEHLQIHSARPFELLPLIANAGEILLGETTPFSLANYACGANAVLPTGGRAAGFSAVSVRDFIKYSSVVHVTSGGFAGLRDRAAALADYEGFAAHAEALKKRGKDGRLPA
ncbi:MAG: histidinol dehydrogenase [Spirochaetia bacterium]|jgi:histidinol dehydrogenase|nr:histidinol dehydrogenase [Spirochaetia bacterium]